jgi:phytanoyl-CoA dioxygenase PhyH
MKKLSPIVAKVRRKAIRLRNRLRPMQTPQVARLVELIGRAPASRPDIDSWCVEVQDLVKRGIVDRVSNDDLALILAGLVAYRNSGVTPESAQLALVRAYENSSGLLQEVLQKALFPKFLEHAPLVKSELFGDIDARQTEAIVAQIREDGYSILPMRLDAQLMARIRNETLGFSYHLKGGKRAGGRITAIDPAQPPECISAYADAPSVAGSALLQGIARDPFFVRVASEYLGSTASVIDSTLWYTFPAAEPSADTAQLFHYDLDTIRWLKLFIYFTDVGAENGPHEYVRASHKPENKVPEVLMKDYARLEDAEMDRYYAGERRRVGGVAGTMFFGDTRCFHKGNSVSSAHRLVYSPIYAASRIGYFHG